ncbi:MAG: UDP-N-acetyl-D-mannosaminuronic acid dehydrogenase [Alphaproteobacteria bacterium]
MTKSCVIGLGYIGLPTAGLLAASGHEVVGVDINDVIVGYINAGKPHFEEKGLETLISTQVHAGNLKASNKPETADTFLIIVPTPFFEADKSADMKYVRQASKDISSFLVEGNLIILESTSALGATKKDVMDVIHTERPELLGRLHFAFCPERAIPGNTLFELENNDRVVGGVDEASTEKAVAYYQSFIQGEILPTSDKTAEMVKLCENAFRDVNIAYANELSMICDKLGVDVWQVIKLANHHPRVNILQPGPGVGGHCIAIDPWFIAAAAPNEAKLITQARQINDSKPHWVAAKVQQAVAEIDKKDVTVGLLGLAFKPNVDDMRESPSLTVAHLIGEKVTANIIACEPYIDDYKDIKIVALDTLLEQADVIVMLTDHDAFKHITLAQLSGKKIIDTRGSFV